jgi:hypothetical protein
MTNRLPNCQYFFFTLRVDGSARHKFESGGHSYILDYEFL